METLLSILKKLHHDVDFTVCDTLIDDGIFDSFDILSLVADIDAEFDVAVPVQDITPENFNSAKNIYALIERLSDE